jgi:hypothetical protein
MPVIAALHQFNEEQEIQIRNKEKDRKWIHNTGTYIRQTVTYGSAKKLRVRN